VAQLPEVAQALLEPQIYPDKTSRVDLVQTQMSFLFLTDNYVYKVKKPVDLGFLDYTTLEKRLFFCRQEVELNRRLCPETYLGVIPITREGGKISLTGRGEAVEYAVKMHRLPADRMMDHLLPRQQMTPEMIDRVSRKLVDFHQRSLTGEKVNKYGTLEIIRLIMDENFLQTENIVGIATTEKQYEDIRRYTYDFIRQYEALFNSRVAAGRIRDCHGDLHAAHICFTDGICIYDCIEFNDRLRYCDVAAEIAFLAMDLDHYGRADLSRRFIQTYIDAGGDTEIKSLLKFYKCYRAYVRAKVGGFKFADPYIGESERKQTLEGTKSYFDLAESYTRKRPLLLITTGLVGSGKTSVAEALAKRLALTVISSDIVRKQLAGIPPTEHRLEGMESGIYSPEFSRRTYDIMLQEAKNILREGDSVILDASFIKAAEREKALGLAREMDSGFMVLECVLDEENTKERLEKRFREGSVSDGRWAIYGPQKSKFEPVVEVPAARHLVIDTAIPLKENITHIMPLILAQE
jgi:uncharacterized protein